MDLLATFDMVDHDFQLQILNKAFGKMNTALKWFESYVRPRNQSGVSVNGKTSAERKLSYSVPQGFCAGATILHTYISTLGTKIPDSSQ